MSRGDENASGSVESAIRSERVAVEERTYMNDINVWYSRRNNILLNHGRHHRVRLDSRFSTNRNAPASADRQANSAFCNCLTDGRSREEFDWIWDENTKSTAVSLTSENHEVRFHPEFSCGTAAVRGDQPMTNGQYYWEIKMITPVYGTDMMIGVGTNEMDLFKYRYTFGSLLGSNSCSWALSYTGSVHHKGVSQRYTTRFGQGNVIGVHLDMWRGTLAFFKNNLPLGIAYEGLQGKTLYPMVSSTSARSGMRVIRSCSFGSTLQFLCCMKLRQMVNKEESVLDAVKMPPGLETFLRNNLDWLLCPKKYNDVSNVANIGFKLDLKRSYELLDSSDDDSDELTDYKRRCSSVPFLSYSIVDYSDDD